MRVISAALVAGAMLIVTANTSHAQDQAAIAKGIGTAPGIVIPKDIGPTEPWSAKPIGKYELILNIPEGPMPVELTVSESAGTLTAMFWKVGDNDGHFVKPTVKGNDLVLEGTTPHGALTITLRHHGPKLAGVWQLGEGRGTVEGAAKL
jgi:hypothetical protein